MYEENKQKHFGCRVARLCLFNALSMEQPEIHLYLAEVRMVAIHDTLDTID